MIIERKDYVSICNYLFTKRCYLIIIIIIIYYMHPVFILDALNLHLSEGVERMDILGESQQLFVISI